MSVPFKCYPRWLWLTILRNVSHTDPVTFSVKRYRWFCLSRFAMTERAILSAMGGITDGWTDQLTTGSECYSEKRIVSIVDQMKINWPLIFLQHSTVWLLRFCRRPKVAVSTRIWLRETERSLAVSSQFPKSKQRKLTEESLVILRRVIWRVILYP